MNNPNEKSKASPNNLDSNIANTDLKPIAQALHDLPNDSGVYEYFDCEAKLLYVGKAKNLKKRVKSYFVASHKYSTRIKIMISHIAYIKLIITKNESDALILENSLIKTHHPKYNIMLRDDKSYPYIYIDFSLTFPTFDITRKVIKHKNIKYFGPFISGAREILEAILELCPLVQNKSCLKGKKACLFYQINRCLAPCEGRASEQDYKSVVQKAMSFLENHHLLMRAVESNMKKYASLELYEGAARMRDLLAKLQYVSKSGHSQIDLKNAQNLDVFVFVLDVNKDIQSNQTQNLRSSLDSSLEPKHSKNLDIKKSVSNGVLVKVFVRNGRICSLDSVFVYSYDFSPSSIISIYEQALLSQYSSSIPLLPDEIILPLSKDELQSAQIALENRLGQKINLSYPKRGIKKTLLDFGQKNALELLRSKKYQDYFSTLSSIRELLNLPMIPNSIEVFDTSHHNTKACVGAMIVYENGNFKKNAYRKFHLDALEEYAQMKEMLSRRIVHFKDDMPDLWIIDGGRAQVNLAYEILESCGLEIPVIGISKEKVKKDSHLFSRRAKGAAKDNIHTRGRILRLSAYDKRLQFIQALRDEAHRFAITFHRYTKSKEMFK